MAIFRGTSDPDILKGGGGDDLIWDDTYVGPFKDNAFDGYGTYTFANGDRYEGDFEKSVYEGLGVFSLSDGNQLKGWFRNNRFAGYASDLKGLIEYHTSQVVALLQNI